jgi:hypothetical protein
VGLPAPTELVERQLQGVLQVLTELAMMQLLGAKLVLVVAPKDLQFEVV